MKTTTTKPVGRAISKFGENFWKFSPNSWNFWNVFLENQVEPDFPETRSACKHQVSVENNFFLFCSSSGVSQHWEVYLRSALWMLTSFQGCLKRSFKAEVFCCPTCRKDLGKDYALKVNTTLSAVLKSLFPGYENGRWVSLVSSALAAEFLGWTLDSDSYSNAFSLSLLAPHRWMFVQSASVFFS